MQYDMYHSYTADEHTLRAIGMLHKIESGALADTAPLATQLFRKAHSRRALYAAVFLHDIAKGTGGKHSEKGADLARDICPRLGLSPEETETAAWLVENHLLMTMTAFKRDLADPKTVADFAQAVQSPERLKLLTIMTAADIMAVGPGKWNNWKAGLLEELHHKTLAYLSGAGEADDMAHYAIQRKKVRRLVGDHRKTFNMLIDTAPPWFWTSFSAETVAGFIQALHGRTDRTVIRVAPAPVQDYTEVFVHTPDRKGLFATLSGAMAAGGASIAGAQIFTLSNGMALDVFQVQTLGGQAYDNGAFLQKTVKAALDGKLDLSAEIAERQKQRPRKSGVFAVQPRVIFDNEASASCSVIEVNGKDRPGFLYDVTHALTEAGLQIHAARIATFGSRAVDVFYVKDLYGMKITHPAKMAEVEAKVSAIL
jgi:[protein-PII] uridylyltransferase